MECCGTEKQQKLWMFPPSFFVLSMMRKKWTKQYFDDSSIECSQYCAFIWNFYGASRCFTRWRSYFVSSWASKRNGTSKSSWRARYERLWLTEYLARFSSAEALTIENHSTSHMPITWFLNTAAQIESSHRNCPLSDKRHFSRKFLSQSSMMNDIGWKENCLKQSLTMWKRIVNGCSDVVCHRSNKYISGLLKLRKCWFFDQRFKFWGVLYFVIMNFQQPFFWDFKI